MCFLENIKLNCIFNYLSINREQDLKMQCNMHLLKKKKTDNEFMIEVVKGYFCPLEQQGHLKCLLPKAWRVRAP